MIGIPRIPRTNQIKLITSSKLMLGTLIDVCASSHDTLPELVKGLQDIFGCTEAGLNEHQCIIFATFCRSIISKLKIARSSGESSDETGPEVISEVSRLIHQHVWQDAFAYAFEEKEGDDLTQKKSILLVAELLRASAYHKDWLSEQKKKSLELGIVEKVCKVVNSDVPDWELQSTSYLVASLAVAKPSHETRRDLVNEILQPRMKSTSILENAFCALIKEMDATELNKCLEKLASADASNRETVFQLRLCRLIVLNLTSPDQVEAIAKFSGLFLSNCLKFLARGQLSEDSSDDDGIACAVTLITDMASSRNTISLRGRDIALILSHVNSAMGKGNPGCDPDFVAIASQVYNSCFSLVSFFLQRFSKQLHDCVPSVISTMSVMLQHTLYGELPEVDIIARCQKFTRLCELLLPHGDVYKKHVLCLLVEFVHALRGNMDLVRKNNLAPAIYSLLDILQEYETMQLNSMLDNMGRALLRSVHENYRKLHVYKGQ
jgi:hypothetical protein